MGLSTPITQQAFNRRARLIIKSRVRLPGPSFGDAFLADLNAGPEQTILDISDNRIAFQHKKEWKWTPNVGHFTAYNLSQKSRAALQGSGNKCQLYAGYGENLVLIGTIDARVNHKHAVTEWETKLEGGDGGRAFQYARLTKAYAGGVKAIDIANDLAFQMGQSFTTDSQATLNAALGAKTFRNGWTSQGFAAPILRNLLMNYGLTWSTQDGKIQVFVRDGLDGFKALNAIFDISPSSGLIQSPEYQSPPHPGKPQLLKVTILLNGLIGVGSKINLQSKQRKGLYKVWSCTHNGDTHGGAWQTELDCQALQGSQ